MRGRSGKRRLSTLLWQIAIGLGALAIWQWGWALHDKLPWLVPDILDPYFVSKPSDIYQPVPAHGLPGLVRRLNGRSATRAPSHAASGKSENNLWIAPYFTLKNTLWGFAIGVKLGLCARPAARPVRTG